MRANLVLLGLALASHVVLAIAYLRATPAFEGPDENDHCLYAYYLAQAGRLPLIKDSAARLGRPSYDEISLGHHPPLYYALLAATMRAFGEGDWAPTAWQVNPHWLEKRPDLRNTDWRKNGAALHWQHGYDEHAPASEEIGVLRWLRAWSVLFGAISVLATWALGRVLFPEHGLVAGLAALLLAVVPQWSFVHGCLENGNLAAALSQLAILGMALALRRRRLGVASGAVLGALAGLALLAKFTSVFLGPLLAFTYGFALWRWREQRRAVALSGALALAVLLAVSGWCLLRNWRLYGDPLAIGAHAIAYASNHVPRELLWEYLVGTFPRRTFVSAVGEFGSLILPVPDWAVALAAALLVAGLAGWIVGGRALLRAGGAPLVLAALACAVVVASLVRYNATFIQPQGRYLFPAYGALLVLVAAGLAKLGVERWRWRLVLAALALPGAAYGIFALHFAPCFRAELTAEHPTSRPAPQYASMVEGLRTPPPPQRQRLKLTAPTDGAELREAPTFTWEAPDHRREDRYTLHAYFASGQVVAATYEWFQLELAEPRWTIPDDAWRNLPAGEAVFWKVRRLPDRRRKEGVRDVPESAPIRVTRIE
jgi:4-amino-4-deoxy-L-arabinose transferase-like glycosyltransferase